MDDLKGRVALVTGSSRGIGRAIALALAEAGADVVVNFVRRSAAAQAVELEIRRLERRCVSIQADVSVSRDVERLIRDSEGQLGSVDILVNNAGISRPQPIEEISEQDWDEVIAANLKSCFLVTQAVLPHMRARKWGRVVNLSSVAAQVGGVVGPHYAASKAGGLGLTHFYAQRLAKEGITVNAIAPALVETEMVTSNPNTRRENIPVGRFGSPEEVARVAVMLVRNGYMAGQTINVNGGWFMSWGVSIRTELQIPPAAASLGVGMPSYSERGSDTRPSWIARDPPTRGHRRAGASTFGFAGLRW